MPIFKGFFFDDNDDKKPESHAGQKINSKREREQKMLILCNDQKVNARKEEHSAFKAQKSRKVIPTTCVFIVNKLKCQNLCIGKELKDAIRDELKNTLRDYIMGVQ